MKKLNLFLGMIAFVPFTVLYGQEVPFPDPGHEGLQITHTGKIGDIRIGLWTQYRVIYNYANIPGPGGTTDTDTKSYDFFRQRFRMGIDMQSSEHAGGYIQIEYRGGWGGSSPRVSDPREAAPVINPFNRLDARGLRYGFIYKKFENVWCGERISFSAGILPLTDQVGRVLFDADWDFNVGGVTAGGIMGNSNYRVGYVQLVEGVGGTQNQIDKDGSLIIADYNLSFKELIEAGFHIYNLTIPELLGVTATKHETWYGFTAKGTIRQIDLNGMIILNNGKIGNESHTGMAIKFESGISIDIIKVSAQVLSATGDKQGSVNHRFVTVHQVVGTEGYWGYTHIFTANAPSDVNDIGLEIGNGGAGLSTLQAKLELPLGDKLDLQLFSGWFLSNEKRNDSNNMGAEFGGMLAYPVADNLTLELGAAFAGIGDFYGQNADNLKEFFARFQLTW